MFHVVGRSNFAKTYDQFSQYCVIWVEICFHFPHNLLPYIIFLVCTVLSLRWEKSVYRQLKIYSFIIWPGIKTFYMKIIWEKSWWTKQVDVWHCHPYDTARNWKVCIYPWYAPSFKFEQLVTLTILSRYDTPHGLTKALVCHMLGMIHIIK